MSKQEEEEKKKPNKSKKLLPGLFTVKKILDDRIRNGKVEYLI